MMAGTYFSVQTCGSGGCPEWYASTRYIDAEREALRIHATLPFLLPVRVWRVRVLQDGLNKARIRGAWEWPTLDDQDGR